MTRDLGDHQMHRILMASSVNFLEKVHTISQYARSLPSKSHPSDITTGKPQQKVPWSLLQQPQRDIHPPLPRPEM
jgi:hypothetical protein